MVFKETNHHVTTTNSFLTINRVITPTAKLQLHLVAFTRLSRFISMQQGWQLEGLPNCKVVVALMTRLIVS